MRHSPRRPRPSLAVGALVTGMLAATLLPTGQATAAVPTSAGPQVLLTGDGWGHSVGMSQYGARAMAQQGFSAPAILQHYYRGTSVGQDARVADAAPVRVDLFRNRAAASSMRVDLRAVGAVDASAAPTTGVRVDLGGGQFVRDLPTTGGTWVSHDPAGGRYVLHQGDTELGSGTDDVPVAVTPGAPANAAQAANPGIVKVDQLASPTAPYVGTFRWGVLSIGGPGNGTMVPVLVQPLQNYLWGVAEVPGSWETEVLRAQAITARTYAGRFGGQTISATPANQAYAGYDKERSSPAWVDAVNATSGVALTYQGALAEAYYSSSHGAGRSENSEDSWAYAATVPYLRSIDDPYSRSASNPYRGWTATASNADFAAEVGLVRVSNVAIVDRTAGGSPRTLRVSGWDASGARVERDWAGRSETVGGQTRTTGAGSELRGMTARTVRADGGVHGATTLPSQQIAEIRLAPFDDDERSVHQYNIGAVAATGVTTGCTTTSYCPTRQVTRGQMAAFLARATGLAPDTGTPRFDDVAGSPFVAQINALAAAGKISGFADGSFRPGAPVTRDQMATFLTSAFSVAPSDAQPFTDVAGSIHLPGIRAVAGSGITAGCGPTTYCPGATVTREQMASFLARALRVGD